ncbi:uncharacterized protein ACN63O_017020 [Diretmus argenteus]
MASTQSNAPTYKMISLDNDINQHFQDAIDVIQHSESSYIYPEYKYYETLGAQQSSLCQISCCLVTHPSEVPGPVYDWTDTSQQSWPQGISDVSLGHSMRTEAPQFYSILPSQRNSKGRKKLRLYEYLYEALHDPNMGDSIQWTDSGSGTFHFISKNKEKLAECWGQRKGNRKTMTYQKMARALRNYSRTGEIIKVRRKLTYQFNPLILQRLGTAQVPMHLPCLPAPDDVHTQQQVPPEQSYCGCEAPDWNSWYEQYPLQEDYNQASSFSSHSITKDSFQEKTDLEIILDFVEEYYRQNPGGRDMWNDATPALNLNTATLSEHGSLPNFVTARQSSKHRAAASGSGRKVRLFHFLFEMLEDPSMAHCVSWVPAATGVFCFSSTNKDQVAALWGQRKGNKRPMTYQKMSRALRNYARSGEIFKVKKKLTYQFSRDTLMSLQKCHQGDS